MGLGWSGCGRTVKGAAPDPSPARAWLIRAALAFSLSLALAGCAPRVPVPDICKMPRPRGLSWVHARVRWSGVMIGSGEHGYVLSCDRRLSGFRLDWDEQTRGREALEPLLDTEPGLLRVTVEGQLREGENGVYLFATAFDRPHRVPMSYEEDAAWLDRLERAAR
jgi:hypothetical protein